MIADLRAFLGRSRVIDLLVAFALAAALVSFVAAVVNGLVLTPIQERASSIESDSPLSFVLGGRVFDTTGILMNGLVLLVIVVGASAYVHLHDAALWEGLEVATCPHCLSEIPAAAPVCSYCTRDIGTG